MAICLRRIFRNYTSFSYPTIHNPYVLLDQRNTTTNSDTVIEINHDYTVPRILLGNVSNQKAIESAFLSSNCSIIRNKCYINKKRSKSKLMNDVYCDNIYLVPLVEKETFHCAKEREALKERDHQKDTVGSPLDRPKTSQLRKIYQKLCEDLPLLFQKPLDHNIYHENMVFENNIRGTRTIGIKNYLKQIAFLRVYASVLFTSVKFEILKITIHEEDGTVRVRWRIKGMPGFKVIVLFWKQKVWRKKTTIEHEEGWFDGFSIFYVKGDGLIHKHVATKLMPDEAGGFLSIKNPLAAKLALIVGLTSQDLASSSRIEADYIYLIKNFEVNRNISSSHDISFCEDQDQTDMQTTPNSAK